MQEITYLACLWFNKCERPWKFISGLLTLSFLFTYTVIPVLAICDGEAERSVRSAKSIALEWPLRPPNDSPSLYLQSLGDRLIQRYKATQGWFKRNFWKHDWPDGKWYFSIMKDLSPNAFSIGNGRTYVTDGTFIFVRTEAELAANRRAG